MSFQEPSSPCHAGRLRTQQIPESLEIHRVETTESTNDLAMAWLRAGSKSHPKAWVAREQTAGKGTQGRSWASPRGGLWMSIAFPLTGETARVIQGLGLRMGLAAYRACTASAPHNKGHSIRVRWPNDLIALDADGSVRKFGGILIQQCSQGVVIGIGINANNPPPITDASGHALRTEAASLSDLAGTDIDLAALEAATLAHALALAPLAGLSPDLLDEIHAALYRPPASVTLTRRDGSTVRGVIAGISTNPDTLGALIIRDDRGHEQVCVTGEVL